MNVFLLFPLIFVMLCTVFSTQVEAKTAASMLNRANSAEPETIDPHKSIGVPEGNIVRDLFEGLVGEDRKGNIVPGVATSWTISEDELVYTFHLRSDAKWSTGEPLTAHDFVFSMRRVLSPKTAAPYTNFLFPIKHAEQITKNELPPTRLDVVAIKPHTLQITLERPTPYFLESLIHVTTFPVNQANVEQWQDEFTQPQHLVSNGAYILTKWVINGQMTLEKNPHYWNAAHVKLDVVNYLPITDKMTMVRMYQAGQVDFTSSVPTNQFKALQKELGSQIKVSPYLGNYFYSLNLDKPPLKDNVKLRQALTMAVDREAITTHLLAQEQTPLYGLLPTIIKGATPMKYTWADLSAAERIAQAKKLYEEAGYSKENPAQISLLYNTTDEHKKLALAVSSMWKQHLGVITTLENQEWKVFLGSRRRGDFVIARNGWIADYNYPSTFLELFMCDSPQNYSRFCDPQFDTLLNNAANAHDEAERKRFFDEAQTVLLENYPFLPLYELSEYHLVKPYVQGYTGENPLQHTYTKDLWIAGKPTA